MARAKTEECPVCGDMFSPQGLVGHLRMAHGVNTVDDAKNGEVVKHETSESDEIMRESGRTMQLIDRLSEIGDLREQVNEWSETDFFFTDETPKRLNEVLDEFEERIRDRLNEDGTQGQEAKETARLGKEWDQVRDLIERFCQCRQKRRQVQESSVSSKKEALNALDRVEEKIRNQLEKIRPNATSKPQA